MEPVWVCSQQSSEVPRPGWKHLYFRLRQYLRSGRTTSLAASGTSAACAFAGGYTGSRGSARACASTGPFTLTVNNRQAQIPGGSALAAVGVNHQWITTNTGAAAGLGTQQGVPQSDVPGVETFVVDHTGQVADSSTTYTNVDQGAAMSYLQPGKRVGNWVPGVSDCNTWTCNVVRNSTPHDIVIYEYTPYWGYRSSVQKNVVVYSDGSVRKPGGKR